MDYIQRNQKVEQIRQKTNIGYYANEGVTVRIRFIDLFAPHSSLVSLLEEFEYTQIHAPTGG
jgi:hypothetical protein